MKKTFISDHSLGVDHLNNHYKSAIIKTILCYGDSNVRGFIPGTFDIKTRWSERYAKNKRWTGILQNTLGENYDVVEEGIGGRTTCFDEILPGRPFRNGLSELPVCLESHYCLVIQKKSPAINKIY